MDRMDAGGEGGSDFGGAEHAPAARAARARGGIGRGAAPATDVAGRHQHAASGAGAFSLRVEGLL